ncbi:unnamed protein product [Cylindrotheca closterium]|uniref:MYND-type domain-containing protein n=1 Tax=Cylindrotheca closterium TaxID=2856 RepID=A0AAD2G053_9STRA|nr:unnamed protein product [Cylindrotheca closterium]
MDSFDNVWSSEKALKKLEATGILEVYFRCLPAMQQLDHRVMDILIEIQYCPILLNKKCKRGSPCGEALWAILEGNDGRPDLIKKMQRIHKFVELSVVDPFRVRHATCGCCGIGDTSAAFQKSLMKCSRCKTALYCSKVCQRSHWSEHKLVCIPIAEANEDHKNASETISENWMIKNYSKVMVQMIVECQKTGLKMKDMVLELDFMENKDGIIPAVEDPAIFKIAPIRTYIEGSRPDELDWYGKKENQETYEQRMKSTISSLTPDKQTTKESAAVLIRYARRVTCLNHDDNLTEEALGDYRDALQGCFDQVGESYDADGDGGSDEGGYYSDDDDDDAYVYGNSMEEILLKCLSNPSSNVSAGAAFAYN